MARYFVTGATGFVGGVLAAQLRAAGHAVVVLARDPSRAGSLARLGCEVHGGDITDRASLDPPMRGVDGVFHVAGWYRLGARDGREGERINVDGTRNVLEVMRELRVPKGVYTSTLAVYGDTHGRLVSESHPAEQDFPSHYDRTKWAAHAQVAVPLVRAGLPLVIVQPGLVYGPGDTSATRRTLVQYLRRRLPLVPAGAAYCWAHVDDVADGHVRAMEQGRPGECYHLAGPPCSLVDALALAERITSVKGPRLVAPPWLLRTVAAVLAPVAAVAPLPEDYQPELLRVLAGVTYLGSSEKARRELGWQPRPLEAGLAETLRHEMGLLGMPVKEAA
jgi:nucleoside-diphosphate-sugar epimerase